MKILIAGCGYLGTHAGILAAAADHRVWGLSRHPEGLPAAITPVKADLADAASLADLPQAEAVIVCQAPKRGESYDAAYRRSAVNLSASLMKKMPAKVVLISSTSVYGVTDGSWVDETTPADPSTLKPEEAADARALLDAERTFLQSGIPCVVLRLGGLYGPGRHRLKALLDGKLSPSFSGSVYTNRIRVEDAARAVLLALEKGRAGEIYLGVDDEPSSQREFYEWVYRKLSIPVAAKADTGAPHGSNKRCSNRKIKALGLTLRYPSFREGYDDLIREAKEAAR